MILEWLRQAHQSLVEEKAREAQVQAEMEWVEIISPTKQGAWAIQNTRTGEVREVDLASRHLKGNPGSVHANPEKRKQIFGDTPDVIDLTGQNVIPPAGNATQDYWSPETHMASLWQNLHGQLGALGTKSLQMKNWVQ